MKVWDESGNPVEASEDVVVNDLTKAQIYDKLPDGVRYIPIVIDTNTGNYMLGLVSPEAIAKGEDLEAVSELVDSMLPAAEIFPTFKEQVDAKLVNLSSLLDSKTGLGNAVGKPVEVNGTTGTSTMAAREDHTHAARVQRKVVQLDADGLATWTFNKPFDNKPCVNPMVFQTSTTQPIVVEGVSFVMANGKYAGVTVKGYRSRALPVLTTLPIGALLTGVVTGVNTLTSALTGYNMFAGGQLSGVEVHLSAGDQM